MIPRAKRNSFLPRSSLVSEGADYRVPLNTVSAIVDVCERIGLHLTEEDLIAPSSARLQLNLEAMIGILLPWRLEMMDEKLENALSLFDNTVMSSLIDLAMSMNYSFCL
jgi:hypothetical protein